MNAAALFRLLTVAKKDGARSRWPQLLRLHKALAVMAGPVVCKRQRPFASTVPPPCGLQLWCCSEDSGDGEPDLFQAQKNKKISFSHYFFLEQHKEGKSNQKIPSWFVAIERGKKKKKTLRGSATTKKAKKESEKLAQLHLNPLKVTQLHKEKQSTNLYTM